MSKPAKNTCSVSILDKEYNINCQESERDALMRSVDLLNNKINEIRATGKVVGGERIAIMAALNLAHDLLEQQHPQADISESDDSEVMERVQKINTKLETALAQHQQIELT